MSASVVDLLAISFRIVLTCEVASRGENLIPILAAGDRERGDSFAPRCLRTLVIERRCQKLLNRPRKRSRHEFDVVPNLDICQQCIVGSRKAFGARSRKRPLLATITEIAMRLAMPVVKAVQIFEADFGHLPRMILSKLLLLSSAASSSPAGIIRTLPP